MLDYLYHWLIPILKENKYLWKTLMLAHQLLFKFNSWIFTNKIHYTFSFRFSESLDDYIYNFEQGNIADIYISILP